MEWPRPFAADAAGKVVATKSADPVAIEQYRRLADALRQVQRERGAKIVMIASAVAGEGRTLTATNLALSLADAHGQRVLLVDADLRHPRIHQLFQVTAGAGLSGALQSPVPGKLPVIGLTAGVTLLPAGRPQGDPAPLIDSARMREVLAEASRSFDWIVMDTPPVTVAPDAGLLAPLADIAILVVDAGRTPRKLVEEAVDVIGRDQLVGVVLNRVEDVALAIADAQPNRRHALSPVDRGKPILAD